MWFSKQYLASCYIFLAIDFSFVEKPEKLKQKQKFEVELLYFDIFSTNQFFI